MANQTGIAIVIKAFLPTGKTLDEQFNALSIVKSAHETGDYSTLLKAASVEDVKTEQKTRRIEDAPQASAEPAQEAQEAQPDPEIAYAEAQAEPAPPEADADQSADVPEFVKRKRSAA